MMRTFIEEVAAAAAIVSFLVMLGVWAGVITQTF